jgi:hypothetical protein
LLDAFLQQGYDLAIGLEQGWPFFQSSWSLFVGDDGFVALTPDVNVIEQLTGGDGQTIVRTDPRWLQMAYGATPQAGAPSYWAQFNRQLVLMPPPAVGYALRAHGYRHGADWIAGGASAECDCDRRLHIPICWYAASLGYAQQEDEVLEATYANRFKESVGQARDAIMRPWPGAPRQFAYTHYPTRNGYPGGPAQLVLEVPAGP